MPQLPQPLRWDHNAHYHRWLLHTPRREQAGDGRQLEVILLIDLRRGLSGRTAGQNQSHRSGDRHSCNKPSHSVHHETLFVDIRVISLATSTSIRKTSPGRADRAVLRGG